MQPRTTTHRLRRALPFLFVLSAGALPAAPAAAFDGTLAGLVRERMPLVEAPLSLDRARSGRTMASLEATLIAPDASRLDVRDRTRSARRLGARAMVVRPEHIEEAARAIGRAPMIPKTVIGFPRAKFTSLINFPRVLTSTKIQDLRASIDGAARGGATRMEVDMVLDVHSLTAATRALRRGNTERASTLVDAVRNDVEAVVSEAKRHGASRGVDTKVMVILETSLLSHREVAAAAAIVGSTHAIAVKTSTGYGARGASVRDVRIMAEAVGYQKIIKASGGVSPDNAAALRRAGAHVFGTSNVEAFRGFRFPTTFRDRGLPGANDGQARRGRRVGSRPTSARDTTGRANKARSPRTARGSRPPRAR